MARRRSPNITTVALVASLAAACGLGNAFAAAGAGDVVFVWNGPAALTVDSAVAIDVTVLVDGSPVAGPTLQYSFPDTTRVTYASTTDSIVGLRPGPGEFAVRLLSSLATTPVDSVFRLQVRP